MKFPKIIGKFGDNETDIRSDTELVSEVSVPLCINGDGEVRVSIFESTDSASHGGFVLQITMDKQDSGFQPYSVNKDDGVELHIAGEMEAKKVIKALKAAISTL